ncbi:MAG: hypothetical protein IPP85_17535 [Propionivibrio sp.]|nr:hypothetical protein [Propionivibrio sp.]
MPVSLAAGGLSSLSGTIKNGTLINTNSTPNFNALGGSTLDGVTLGSNLNFIGGSYTLIKNSLLLANGITVNLGNHSFYWNTLNPTQELKTVSGNATINAAGGYPIYAGYGGTGQTVTIGSGITLQGYGYIGDSSVATIVNAGTLVANTAGQTFTINPTTFTNGVDLDPGPGVNIAGTLRATAGTLAVAHELEQHWRHRGTGGTLTITGTNLSNTGTLSVGAGSILNLGGSLTAANLGTFSRTAGSTVNLTGILDLSSGTLDIGSAGIFGSGGLSSLSGTIKNGTLINTNSTPNFNALGGSTLDGVTLGSNLNFTGGSYTDQKQPAAGQRHHRQSGQPQLLLEHPEPHARTQDRIGQRHHQRGRRLPHLCRLRRHRPDGHHRQRHHAAGLWVYRR